MEIKVGFEISYYAVNPTPMVTMLNIHPSRFADIVGTETVVAEPSVPGSGPSGVPSCSRTFELTGPAEWKKIAEISTSALHPKGKVQEGSGGVGAPTYYGGKYALIAAAPRSPRPASAP